MFGIFLFELGVLKFHDGVSTGVRSFSFIVLGTHSVGPVILETLVFQKYTSMIISPSVFSVLFGTPVVWMLKFLDCLSSFVILFLL